MKKLFKIILCMIALFFKDCICMEAYPEELRQAIITKNVNIVSVKRFLHIGMNIFSFNEAKINEIFEKIAEKITPTENKWTLVVFSEYFFGEINPLNNNEVNYIVGKCNELTNRYEKVIIHINFLHTFNTIDAQCPEWVKYNYIPIANAEIGNRLINTDQNMILPVTAERTHRGSNYSLVIWNDLPISIYRKSTYCNEANAIFNSANASHAYEFGDFLSHQLGREGIHQQIADIFAGDASLVITRICADMNREAFLTDQHLRQNGILILPAKEAPTSTSMDTTTLQVDDKMPWNKFIVLKKNNNTTLVKPNDDIRLVNPIGMVYPSSNYLGLCFTLSDIPIDELQKLHSINNCFSDGQYQGTVVESLDEDVGCCCCCCCF
jgi:hypothetical protein